MPRTSRLTGKLPFPNRPNDFQRLVLECHKRGMYTQEIAKVFGIGTTTIRRWRGQWRLDTNEKDVVYFMRRARELGASDEMIARWFGFDRIDKVSMLLAKAD